MRNLALRFSVSIVAIGVFASTDQVMAQTSYDDAYGFPYNSRIDAVEQIDENATPTETVIPLDFVPWWHQPVQTKQAKQSNALTVTMDGLVEEALIYAPQIHSFSDLPLIREQTITEAAGVFDWTTFAESDYRDTSDPVGNLLTTGGPDRFLEQDWRFDAGLRRRNLHGGRFEVSQELGYLDNNSNFFIPTDQGRARLRVGYTQSLLRGRGEYYNSSMIALAQLDASAAHDEFSRQLQAHVLEVAGGYWSLYLERASLLQRRKLIEESREIYNILEQRQALDVVQSQMLRAKSALADRVSMLARAEASVHNAQSRIITLVNDPDLTSAPRLEMLPITPPATESNDVSLSQSMVNALHFRPEISQAKKQIQAAARRRDVACNDLMPVLDAFVESYIAGLQGESDIGQAYGDQFSRGRPSYTVGLMFEYPLGNRVAKAQLTRRELELRQLRSQLETTIQTLLLEVEVAVREQRTAFTDMQTKYLAMQANDAEVKAIRSRWEIRAGEDAQATLYLDSLLDAQMRLAVAEFQFATAIATYNLAQMNLARATGTLLDDQAIEIVRTCEYGLPRLKAFRNVQVLPTPESPDGPEVPLP